MPETTTFYEYPDERGRVLLRKVRYYRDGEKRFRMQARSRDGYQWMNPRDLVRLHPKAQEHFAGLLYGIPLLQSALLEPVHGTAIWAEGEKDADSINDLFPFGGVVAVSHWQGGGRATEEQALRLAAWRGGVVVCIDRDEVGAVCGWRRWLLLRRIGIPSARIRVARARGGEPGSGRDVFDHLNDGYGLDELVPINLHKLEKFAQAHQAQERLRGSGSVSLTPTPRRVAK